MSNQDNNSDAGTETATVADGGAPQGVHQPAGTDQESITDIFNKESTKTQLLVIVGVFAGVGLGMGLAGYFTTGMFMEGEAGDELVGGFLSVAAVMAIAIATPVVGSLLGVRASRILESENDTQVLATVGLGALAGHVIAFILALFIIGQQFSSGDSSGVGIGDHIVDILLAGGGAAVASVVAVYLVRSQE